MTGCPQGIFRSSAASFRGRPQTAGIARNFRAEMDSVRARRSASVASRSMSDSNSDIVPGVSIWRRSNAGPRGRWRVTYRHPVTGKRKTESVSPVRSEAVEYARRVRINLRLGRSRREPPTLPVVTYFIRAGTGPVKIGTTTDLAKRLRIIQCSCPDVAVCMGYLDGNRERELHDRFAALRMRGEWFRPGPKLLAFIAAEAKAWNSQ